MVLVRINSWPGGAKFLKCRVLSRNNAQAVVGKRFFWGDFPPFSPFWSPLQSARSGRCEGLEK